ncbi:MAG TPA: GspMb/PilO family protein [Candidatus Udaeobacter sp.]|jgi:hypothetical protein|nr:GspMb/PilO family protein [Candidatus Udaeobacter sp.]
MNPQLAALLRRDWPVIGALLLFLGFAFTQAFAFLPTANRYDAAVKRSAELGLGLDPSQSQIMLPPRVFALLTDHALSPAEAQEKAGSGALTANLLEDLNQLAGQHGIVVLATEPGPVSQDPQSVHVRAHLRLRGGYAAFVSFLADVARSGSMTALDRFSLQPGEGGSMLIDLAVSRYVLKQGAGNP